MSIRRIRSSSAVLAATMLAMPLAISPLATVPAYAWRIVFDPSNYAQNVLTAARTLEQINHQITSLQNEATMLINQARNLASLPFSSLQTLQQNVQRTQQLLSQAQNIAFDVERIDQVFQQQYGSVSMSATDQQLVTDARGRWQNTVGGLQDAMRVQAGNQLLALQSQQLSDLVALLAANGRSGALTEAERTAAAEQGREHRRRFLTPGSSYQAGSARMFNGN